MQITIGHLYPDLMNIYGDQGNIIALKKRAEWRGIELKIKNISQRDKLKKGDVDIFFFGGGQDQAQELVAKDLITSGKGKVIKQEAERGVPLLAICGGYQLLGDYYKPFASQNDSFSSKSKPHNSPKLPGIGLFPVYTVASCDRMIGNIVISSQLVSSQLVGFENHSGKTYLKKGGEALGKVIKGFGNNGEDRSEGCIYQNAIGTYTHGSLLPKNPQLADWLLKKALEVKYGREIKLEPLDDSLENKAHQAAISKFC